MTLQLERPVEPAQKLHSYLEETVGHRVVPGSGLSRLIGKVLPPSARPMVRKVATGLVLPREQQKAARVARGAAVRLHLGCGESPKPGWVNIDMVGLPVDIAWDLNRRLPFPRASVDAIFHEHVLEHLSLERGLAFLRECYRVAKPGAIIRIGVPDAGRYVRSYSDPERSFLELVRPGRPTAMLALQEEFYWHGHRTMYDFETLEMACKAAGFSEVRRREFGESDLSPVPDSEHRRYDTLYIELTR